MLILRKEKNQVIVKRIGVVYFITLVKVFWCDGLKFTNYIQRSMALTANKECLQLKHSKYQATVRVVKLRAY